ncbi:MAG: DUF333 domain-containing protein [Neisseriaceae bacterium]|nr:DUF333 domain-containing protein [Neisseriaceae bacterium]
MQKYIILASTILTACSTNTMNQIEIMNIANPAAVFCIQQGGKSVIRQDAQGNQYGVCILPNGEEIDEWAYFRAHHQ